MYKKIKLLSQLQGELSIENWCVDILIIVAVPFDSKRVTATKV